MEYECTPQEEILSRIARFQELLQGNDIAGALISQNADLFYFAGTIQPSSLFIPAQGEPVLAVQGNLDRALDESRLGQIVPLKNSHQLDQALSDFNYSIRGRVGLEMDVLPVRHYFVLCQDFPEADFLDISELIRKVRMVKSEYEILQIRKAAEILNQVMGEAQRSIRPGMTELDVESILGALARRLGHQGRLRMRGYNQEMFYAHIFCGKTAALPSFMKTPLGGSGTTPAIAQGASFNTIAENEPLVIDFGVGINGYVTDMTRTFVIGELPQELAKAYSFAKEVKDFMEHWVRPGRYCSLLYEQVIELAHEGGYQDYFMGYKEHQVPFVGHGLGLEIDEYPLIAPNFHQEFQENMVFAFEPKLVFPGVGAIGVEDDYLVTRTGVERLTTYDDQVLTIDYPEIASGSTEPTKGGQSRLR
ncbi:MAG: aminopeptidase P family protein [Chloroflexi bacterium]|nr:aminopeptidase P family protein [Chloroflexota bacterium]